MALVEQQPDSRALTPAMLVNKFRPNMLHAHSCNAHKESTIPLQGSTCSMWPRAWARLPAGSPEAGLAGGPSCGACPFTCTHSRRSVAALPLLMDAVGNHSNGHHGCHAASWQCSVTAQVKLHLDNSHIPVFFWEE